MLVTIDWGALLRGLLLGLHAHVRDRRGDLRREAREVYELVLDAQEQALAAVQAGPERPRGRRAWRAAVIERAGYGEHFGHGLGHGVGLEVHEGPRLSRTAGEQPLQAGNVVTVEPGVYLPGRLGRADRGPAVVAPGGPEVLTGLSKALTVIS